MARNVEHLNLGSKPAQLYVRLISIVPLSLQTNHVNSGIISSFTFFSLPYTRVHNLFEELCIMRVAAINSFASVLNPRGGVYILLSTNSCITTLQYG